MSTRSRQISVFRPPSPTFGFRIGMFACIFLFMACTAVAQMFSWNQLQAYPVVRSGHSTAVFGSYIYLVGGRDGANNYNLAHRCDYWLASGPSNWVSLTPMNTSRYFAAAESGSNGKIYVFGGYVNGSNTPSNVVEEYDPGTNSWSFKAPMPTPRARMQAVRVNGIIYVMGGMNAANTALNVVQAYNPATNTWATKAPMTVARADFGACTYKEMFFYSERVVCVAGGRANLGTTGTTSVELYVPSQNNWYPYPNNLLLAKYGNTLTRDSTFGPNLLDIGGYLNGGVATGLMNESGPSSTYAWGASYWFAARPMAFAHHFFMMKTPFQEDWVAIGGIGNGNVPANNFEAQLIWIALPAQSIHLQAHQAANAVNVTWKHDPAEVAHYELERSPDGDQFQKIGQYILPSASNDQIGQDLFPLTGNSFYRIVVHRANGETQVSEAVSVDFGRSAITATIVGNATLRFGLPSNESHADLGVFDLQGRRLSAFALNQNQGEAPLDLSGWAAGIYLVRLETATQSKTLKVLVQE
jgi:hypothetical protein